MSSRLPTDEAIEKEDRIDEINKKKQKKHSHPSRTCCRHSRPVGRPGTGSYPAPSPDRTTHYKQWVPGHKDIAGNELAYRQAKKAAAEMNKPDGNITVIPDNKEE